MLFIRNISRKKTLTVIYIIFPINFKNFSKFSFFLVKGDIAMAEDVVLTELEIEENDLLTRAIAYAVAMHRGGLRKGTSIPYIVHPLEVLNNLFLMNADKKLMAAGVLHDTVEDTAATMEDIVVLFGKEVADLVSSHTEKDKSLPWRERKQIALEHLATATKREQMLVFADKLSNMRAIYKDYKELGDDLWKRFNQGKEQQAWYYRAGLKALGELAGYSETRCFYEEFAKLVDDVFGVDAQSAGNLYNEAQLLKEKGNYDEAIDLLKKAAQAENIKAMMELGYLYYTGEHVPLDKEKAFKLFLKPAMGNNIEAMFNVGMAYFYGEGCEQDYKKAYEFLLENFENGQSFDNLDSILSVEGDYSNAAFFEAFNALGGNLPQGNNFFSQFQQFMQKMQGVNPHEEINKLLIPFIFLSVIIV